MNTQDVLEFFNRGNEEDGGGNEESKQDVKDHAEEEDYLQNFKTGILPTLNSSASPMIHSTRDCSKTIIESSPMRVGPPSSQDDGLGNAI